MHCLKHRCVNSYLYLLISDLRHPKMVVRSCCNSECANCSPLTVARIEKDASTVAIGIFEDIDGKTFLEKNRDSFFMKIDECKPNTALDVEDAAYFACMAYTDNEIFNGLKNFVYNSPSYLIKAEDGTERKYDLTLPDICFVLSLADESPMDGCRQGAYDAGKE